MLRHDPRFGTGLAGLTLAALLALPAVVLGNTSGPIAQTGGMTATVPLLGAPLTVAVTLDVVGNITNVDLDPVGDFSATRVGPHAVSFETADGTVQVKIKAKGNKLSMRASASSLDSLIGSGTWSADVFGTGEQTEVAYTIGATTDGCPTLEVEPVTPPAGATVEQQPVETETDDEECSASARIDFSSDDGFVKRLTIEVEVDNEGDRPATLKIQLSGKDRQRLEGDLADLVGDHSWSGFLCDATAVAVTFTVNEDGSVTFVEATGAPATSLDTGNGFHVRFDDTKTKVKVKLVQADDGSWVLRVDAKTDKCKDEPAEVPTVNTPVEPGAEQTNHHGGSDTEGDSERQGESDRQGGSGHDGDKDKEKDKSGDH